MNNIEERIEVVAYNACLKNKDYQSYIIRIKETEKKICETIGDVSLLQELEELISLASSIHLKNAYMTGFRDGKTCLKCAQSA